MTDQDLTKAPIFTKRVSAAVLSVAMGIAGAGGGGAYYGASSVTESNRVAIAALDVRVSKMETITESAKAQHDNVNEWILDTNRVLGGIEASLKTVLERL